MAEESKIQEIWNYYERRDHRREKITLKRTFAAEINLDEARKVYFYVVDISHGGMKIMADFLLPEKLIIPLKLNIKIPLEFEVEMVWHKKMINEMYVMGLKFITNSPQTINNIDDFVSKYSLVGKDLLRLNKMFVLKIFQNLEWKNYLLYALNISLKGIEFTTDQKLLVNEELAIQFELEGEKQPFEADARITSLKDISEGRYKGWLEFTSMDELDELRLSERIKTLLQGGLPSKVVEPIKDFEVP